MFFGSDNTGPVPEQIITSVAAANTGYQASYGDDDIMDRVRAQLRDVLEAPKAAIYLVTTGTAANSLALSCYAQPWEAVFCARSAHVETDECGAPEFFTGGSKLVLLDGENGKIDPTGFEGRLATIDTTDPHVVQKGPLSITQITECGTAYSPDEVKALTTIAKANGMACHMDGARFGNAVIATGASPAELTWKSGIDVLSFGGTKNGLMGVEAVVFFDPDKAWEFELRRKRAGHLLSKHRYLSAQMEAYLKDGLWLELAQKANAQAAKLEQALSRVPDSALIYPRDGNIIFANWPRAGHRKAKQAGAQYSLGFGQSLEGDDNQLLSARLVCNWATSDDDIARFVKAITV